jgi:hypothetical protein
MGDDQRNESPETAEEGMKSSRGGDDEVEGHIKHFSDEGAPGEETGEGEDGPRYFARKD